ncbi:MAG: hypothetical protein CVV44_11050 [Spirochaetae bacterium HGW-Spirochaetae-1]|jgi:hypothetical protein|nr:MAG: hypothetical protein CVV44_11050 [Spirochaetae bacterium HGW-Spirochaetae-1]
MEFIGKNFFMIDFFIGAAVPVTVTVLYRVNKITRFTWHMFWIGCLIGLLWEIPLSTLDGLGVVDIFNFTSPPPVHFTVIIISHTLWDGGLFLLGVWLVNLFCEEPRFDVFKWKELLVLLVWGQVQELAVELLSTGNNGWEYNALWWNPVMFLFNGHNITLIPQLIWLAAPVLFYFMALLLRRSLRY